MSWEIDGESYKACPCGAGLYKLVTLSNDWNQHDERWEMLCASCKGNYTLYSFTYTYKGSVEVQRGWLLRSLEEALIQAEQSLEKQNLQLKTYVIEHYAQRWQEHFQGMSKKAIWHELAQGAEYSQSLGTFYRHIQQSGLTQVLMSYLDYSNLPIVVRILDLNDSNLRLQVEQVKRCERVCEEKRNHIRHELKF